MLDRKRHKGVPPGDYVADNEGIQHPAEAIERRCETVDDVVKNKVFTLAEALTAYKVTPEQFFGYKMLNKSRSHKLIVDTVTFLTIFQSLFNQFDLTHSDLNPPTKKAVAELRKLALVK